MVPSISPFSGTRRDSLANVDRHVRPDSSDLFISATGVYGANIGHIGGEVNRDISEENGSLGYVHCPGRFRRR
jgi:hypothetical protein